jgi:redox-sensitive bicupin YhaK (pirin superfamily)
MIELFIEARQRELVPGTSVRRVLPFMRRRMIGPFIFCDEMDSSTPLVVGPHPHIGLATVTWLFAGRLRHRDSTGSDQLIEPGAVNWMTAGRGVVHSERDAGGGPLHGMQTWVALPRAQERMAPAFAHHPVVPLVRLGSAEARVIVGSAWGARSPVLTFGEPVLAELRLPAGAAIPLPSEHEERGIYVVAGELALGKNIVAARTMAVLAPHAALTLRATRDTLAMLLGGKPADGPRHIWWNFVASDQAAIERARQAWTAGTLGSIAGETDLMVMPT